jgi:haloalkane dehalogenase
MAMHRRSLSPDEQRGYLWPYDSWAHRVAVDAFVRDIPMARSHPSRPALDRVEAGLAQFRHNAILIAWGESDFCFNNLFLQRWQEIFPGAQVHRLADAGHYVLDDARDEILPRLKSFLLGP